MRKIKKFIFNNNHNNYCNNNNNNKNYKNKNYKLIIKNKTFKKNINYNK